MKTKVALIGYSGHALVVAETLKHAGYQVAGYFDKSLAVKNPLNLPYLGFEQDEDFIKKAGNIFLFPAIGNNELRKKIMNMIARYNLPIASAVSPKANVSENALIKCGTLICQGACVNPFVTIGKCAIINTGAIIEHECNLNDFVHIAPGTVLAGNVTIGDTSFVGANAVVKQGIIIGKNVIVGAGSVVLKNIPDNEVWAGNPAKRINCN